MSTDQSRRAALEATIEQQAAEIARLRGIVPEVLEKLNDELCAENEALRAERDALRVDAEHLRALLNEARSIIDTLPGYPKGADLCDRIDAAREST